MYTKPTMNNISKFYENYEKLKTVGQGAFGTAILYRRISDGKQVVIKEVLLLDMDVSEKKAALNEVEVLASLNHPNIIKYFGSFQREGTLIIIMEYADGGNLAQLINAKRNKNEAFTEKSVIHIMLQITAALSYMHSAKILHRDLKSANIFLNMNGNVKVGDFGISKMLSTRSQAQTVVGTPYYLSPEMCEGYDYNDKSDIWAVGCILYELTALRRPFEAMTLPVLVQKITNCEYDDIPRSYSIELSHLVRSILQKSPAKRPSARVMHDAILPRIAKKNESLDNTFRSTTSLKLEIPKERSILYKITDFGIDQQVVPQEVPHKTIISFSVSSTHSLVILSDNNVYGWGENSYGQLAMKDLSINRPYPSLLNFFQRKNIIQCAAGKSFSIFLNTNGNLYSCGDGQMGCLGHGDRNSSFTPKIIESLNGVKITQINCGEEHVVALTSDGTVFTWGSSKSGQLGQGHNQFRCTPLAIKSVNMKKIKSIFCGSNESVLLTVGGEVLVSGLNNDTKLGLRQEKINSFTPVNFKDKVKFVSIGTNHSMFLLENGSYIAAGRNSEGQFGKGNHVNYTKPQLIKFKNKINMIASGVNFTVAVDNKNVIWFWGSNYKTPTNVKNGQKQARSNSIQPLTKNAQEETIVIKEFGFDDIIQEFEIDTIKTPKPILALYSSPNNIKAGNTVFAADIKIKNNNLYLLTHTTSPPPIKEFTDRNLHHNSMTQVDGSTVTAYNLPNML